MDRMHNFVEHKEHHCYNILYYSIIIIYFKNAIFYCWSL